MLPRQKQREIIFQILYSMDFTGDFDEGLLDLIAIKLKVAKSHVRAAYAKVQGIQKHLPDIDAKIQRCALSYAFERILSVEKNILRLGFYEICYEKVPGKVAIAEAIRLCKKFATPESTKFINAILDAEYKLLPHPEKQEALGALNV